MREHNRDKERLEHIAEGFTARNLWHMKQWYLFYSRPEYEQKLKQAVSQFEGLQSPLGVATYSGIKVSELLPSAEQIKLRIKRLRAEINALNRLNRGK